MVVVILLSLKVIILLLILFLFQRTVFHCSQCYQTGITVNVSLSQNNISVQQLTYLLHITSDVQTQLNNLLNTLKSDVATLNDSITTNVQTLNTTITSKYDTLNTAKQDKGNIADSYVLYVDTGRIKNLQKCVIKYTITAR